MSESGNEGLTDIVASSADLTLARDFSLVAVFSRHQIVLLANYVWLVREKRLVHGLVLKLCAVN